MITYFKCPKCNNGEVIMEERGPHTGVFCEKCGRWIKWLNKKEEFIGNCEGYRKVR